MGVVAMEAQALGTPVIGFDAGPMREVIAPGESGLVVPPGDVRALREAMQRVMEDDDLADRLGASGPKVVAARFDLQRNTAAVEDVYEDVMARVRQP